MTFKKIESIGQFRETINQVQHDTWFVGMDGDTVIYDKTISLLTLMFKGTIKTHGTQAAVGFDGQNMWAQSKSQIITPENDNAGFAKWIQNTSVKDFLTVLKYHLSSDGADGADEVIIYGEFVGKGIQKKVAVSKLEKTWIIFGIRYKVGDKWYKVKDPERWLVANSVDNIYSVFDFDNYTINIDFNHLEIALKSLIL